MNAGADRWIRWTTIGCVALLAVIAGTVSYLHMHLLVARHGQPGWVAALTPLSVDGMIVAASTTLLADSRAGRRGGALPWALLVAGSVASLAANVARRARRAVRAKLPCSAQGGPCAARYLGDRSCQLLRQESLAAGRLPGRTNGPAISEVVSAVMVGSSGSDVAAHIIVEAVRPARYYFRSRAAVGESGLSLQALTNLVDGATSRSYARLLLLCELLQQTDGFEAAALGARVLQLCWDSRAYHLRLDALKALGVLHPGIRLEPFKPAIDLPPSTADGSMVHQPVPCGKHSVFFPGVLAMEAMGLGKRYAFVTMCECSIAYLVVLERDGAHFRNDGTLEAMAEAIDRLEGPEYEYRDENGIFTYKELTAEQ